MRKESNILYEGTPGVRINGEGNALDLDLSRLGRGAGASMFGNIWMGKIGDTRAEKSLTPEELRAIRDACTRMLVDMGMDKPIDRAILVLQEHFPKEGS